LANAESEGHGRRYVGDEKSLIVFVIICHFMFVVLWCICTYVE